MASDLARILGHIVLGYVEINSSTLLKMAKIVNRALSTPNCT
jgi:hypothetical protein